MSSWTVSPILRPLISEVKSHNSGMTVYTIGDAAHQAEKSDHNPDQWGFVCAGDFMIGSAFTPADAEGLFDAITAMIRAGDKRCAYVIYNKRIVSSTVQPGVIRAYTLTDPHTNHVHVSVPHGSDPHPTTSWGIYPPQPPKDETVTQPYTETQMKAFPWQFSGNPMPAGKSSGFTLAEIHSTVGEILATVQALSAPTVDVDALADAIVARLPSGTLTKADLVEVLGSIQVTVPPAA